jgi:hypothetical protein
MKAKNIPSEEEFRRASAWMREQDRGLSDVRAKLLDRFREAGVHEVFIFFSPKPPGTFVARVFYRRRDQVEESARTGVSSDIKESLLEELEKAGRGRREELQLDVAFDSDEDVQAHFGGDYSRRLR